MSKSNKGVFLVVGAGVALAVGFGVVYFTVLAPRSERKRVQKEVSSWASKWDAARDCLVGPDPRSSDGYEAVILREALAAEDLTDELRECAEEVRALRRPAGFTSGADVEAAWADLEKKIDKVVEAHALRTAKTLDRPVPDLRRLLGETVAATDLAYARLRDRAGMSAAHPAGDRLPVLPAGRVLGDASGKPIAPEVVIVSGGVVVAVGSVGDRRWLIRHSGPAAVEVIPLGVETVAGLDGGGWGVWTETSEQDETRIELRSGPLDAVGDPGGDGVVVRVLAAGETVEIHAALAVGQDRVALFSTTSPRDGARTAWIARSRDGGATWPDQTAPSRTGVMTYNVDLAQRRLDLLWTEPGAGATRWLVLDASTIAGPLTPIAAALPPAPSCVAGGASWWQVEDGLLFSKAPGGAAAPVPGSVGTGPVIVCRGERLLTLGPAPSEAPGQEVSLCSPTGCKTAAIQGPSDATPAVLLSEKRGPLVALETDGVVLLWTGDPERKQAFSMARMARLAGDQRLAGVVEWGGQLHLVTRTEDSLHIVPFGGE